FCLPAFNTPWLIASLPADSGSARALAMIYPFYMFLSAWLAWKAYPSRSYLSWILLVVMVLSTIAMYMLTTMTENL
ncbi:MAG: hypothetical protein K2K72_01965, partial [Duncaniella sp.]|nr:hypothetical protein [Duncaniella sp.]